MRTIVVNFARSATGICHNAISPIAKPPSVAASAIQRAQTRGKKNQQRRAGESDVNSPGDHRRIGERTRLACSFRRLAEKLLLEGAPRMRLAPRRTSSRWRGRHRQHARRVRSPKLESSVSRSFTNARMIAMSPFTARSLDNIATIGVISLLIPGVVRQTAAPFERQLS